MHSLSVKILAVTSLIFLTVSCIYAAVVGGILIVGTREHAAAELTIMASHLRSDLEHIVHLGLPLESIAGFDEACQTAVSTLAPHAGSVYAVVVDTRGNGVLCAEDDVDTAPWRLNRWIPKPAEPKGEAREAKVGGEVFIEVLSPIHDAAQRNIGFVRMGMNMRDAERDVWSAIGWASLAAISLVLVGIAASAAALGHLLGAPLSNLLEGLREVGRNPQNLAYRMRVSTRDEIGKISAAFNAMLKRLQDVTVSRQELEESQEIVHLLLACSGEGIIVIDDEGKCLLANPAAAAILGVADSSELVGRSVHRVFQRSHLDGSLSPEKDFPAIRAIREHREIHVDDAVFWRADRSSIPVSYRCYPMRKNGEVTGAVIHFVDISQELEARRRERMTERMEALGNLAGGIAHDLNNLLLPILALTSLTVRELPEDDRVRIRLDKVMLAAERAKDLVAQILQFSRADAARLELIDLREVVRIGTGLLREVIPSTVAIKQILDLDAGTVVATQGQINAILINLATNAAYAIGARTGTLSVSLSRIDMEADLAARLGGIETGPYAKLSIADDGEGMDAATMEKIFNPFFTTKPVGEGTGLGLSVVFGTVKTLNGAIAVASEPGVGTTFDIYLPISAGMP